MTYAILHYFFAVPSQTTLLHLKSIQYAGAGLHHNELLQVLTGIHTTLNELESSNICKHRAAS